MSNELHTAAMDPIHGYEEVKRLIEEEHVDVNLLHTGHFTPAVAFAARYGSLQTLDYLIKTANATVDAHSQEKNLLAWAKDNPDPAVLAYVADPQNGLIKRFNDGTTPLHVAVYQNDPQRVRELLSKGIRQVTRSDHRGRTPLHLAELYRQPVVSHTITSHPAFIALTQANKLDPMFAGQAECFSKQAISAAGHEDAIHAAREAIRCRLEMHDKGRHHNYQLGRHYLLLGQCYMEMFETRRTAAKTYASLAVDAIQKAIQQFKSTPEETDEKNEQLAICHADLASIDYFLNRFVPDALTNISRALDFCLRRRDEQASEQRKELLATRAKIVCRQSLEQQAARWGFSTIDVDSDGSCFFHAASLQLETLNKAPIDSEDMRLDVVDHMREYVGLYQDVIGSPKEYFKKLSKADTWVDHADILAFSRQNNVSIVIISDSAITPPTIIKQKDAVATLYFGYMAGNHYLALDQNPAFRSSESIQQLIDRAEIDEWSRPKRVAEEELVETQPARRLKSASSPTQAPQALFAMPPGAPKVAAAPAIAAGTQPGCG